MKTTVKVSSYLTWNLCYHNVEKLNELKLDVWPWNSSDETGTDEWL